MIKIAVIEEHQVYREYLKGLLSRWANKKTTIGISNFVDGEKLFEYSADISEYDIVFIDIAQNQPDGILVAEKLRSMGYKNVLVLTAERNDRACEGYRVNAFRYYIKPLSEEDIKECMDYTLNQKANEHFRYTYRGVTEKIAFCDIVCFESMQHYIDIHTLNGTVRIKGVLKTIQEQCPAYFIRCQRSYIVNIHYITGRRGKQLRLKTGKIVDVSPKYSEILKDAMRN